MSRNAHKTPEFLHGLAPKYKPEFVARLYNYCDTVMGNADYIPLLLDKYSLPEQAEYLEGLKGRIQDEKDRIEFTVTDPEQMEELADPEDFIHAVEDIQIAVKELFVEILQKNVEIMEQALQNGVSKNGAALQALTEQDRRQIISGIGLKRGLITNVQAEIEDIRNNPYDAEAEAVAMVPRSARAAAAAKRPSSDTTSDGEHDLEAAAYHSPHKAARADSPTSNVTTTPSKTHSIKDTQHDGSKSSGHQ